MWHARDLDVLTAEVVLLDVRSADEFCAGHLEGARNIPHTELRHRLTELPTGAPLRVYCASGFRSYLAQRVLRQSGWDDVASLSGGLTTLVLARPAVPMTAGDTARGLAASVR